MTDFGKDLRIMDLERENALEYDPQDQALALREDNARLKDDLHIKTAEWTTMMEENALLRSVLKRIAGDGCGMATKPDEPCHKLYVREDDWCWCCIARQALAREEK